MSAFLYFIPNGNRAVLAARDRKSRLKGLPSDLAVRLYDATWSCFQADSAIEGQHGVIISVDASPGSGGSEGNCGYFPDLQTWLKVEGDEPYWIGWKNDGIPTPADLVRTKTVPGYPVILNDREWTIPCVHAPRSTLPMHYKMTAKGPVGVFDEKYSELMRYSELWWNAFVNGDHSGITYAQEYRFACDLLAINYRVGQWECSADCLNLLESTHILEVISAALGVPAMVAEQEEQSKKKDTQPVG